MVKNPEKIVEMSLVTPTPTFGMPQGDHEDWHRDHKTYYTSYWNI